MRNRCSYTQKIGIGIVNSQYKLVRKMARQGLFATTQEWETWLGEFPKCDALEIQSPHFWEMKPPIIVRLNRHVCCLIRYLYYCLQIPHVWSVKLRLNAESWHGIVLKALDRGKIYHNYHSPRIFVDMIICISSYMTITVTI